MVGSVVVLESSADESLSSSMLAADVEVIAELSRESSPLTRSCFNSLLTIKFGFGFILLIFINGRRKRHEL